MRQQWEWKTCKNQFEIASEISSSFNMGPPPDVKQQDNEGEAEQSQYY